LSPLRIDTWIPWNEVVAELIRRMQDVEVWTWTIEKKISKLSLDVHEANNTPLNIKHSLSKTQAIDYLQSLKNKWKLEIIQFGKSIQRYIELSWSLKKHCTATYSYNEYSKISKYWDLNFVYSNPYTLDDVIWKISLLDFIQCTPSQQKKEITKDRRSKQHVY
jgi:hypothetical protein